MSTGIYKIKNLVTNQVYIGQSLNIENRLRQHKTELRMNKHCNNKLQRAYDEFGEENFSFEIVEEIGEEKLNLYEYYYIELYKSIKNGYNIRPVENVIRKEVAEKISKETLEQEFQNISQVNIELEKQLFEEFSIMSDMKLYFDSEGKGDIRCINYDFFDERFYYLEDKIIYKIQEKLYKFKEVAGEWEYAVINKDENTDEFIFCINNKTIEVKTTII